MLHPLAYHAIARHPAVGWSFTRACWMLLIDDRLKGWALTTRPPTPPAWLASVGADILSWRPRHA